MHHPIFTVGHSSHSWDTFRSLIEKPDIGCVVDVRSIPSSRWGHFRKPELRYRLNQVGISYLHLGVQLGGLPKTGPADYEARALSASFADGIAQILEIASRCRPVLLCAEHEPLECHRCLLVGRHLAEQHKVVVANILRNGRIEAHEETEDRLLARHKVGNDLFRARSQRLAVAYRLQARKLGVA